MELSKGHTQALAKYVVKNMLDCQEKCRRTKVSGIWELSYEWFLDLKRLSAKLDGETPEAHAEKALEIYQQILENFGFSLRKTATGRYSSIYKSAPPLEDDVAIFTHGKPDIFWADTHSKKMPILFGFLEKHEEAFFDYLETLHNALVAGKAIDSVLAEHKRSSLKPAIVSDPRRAELIKNLAERGIAEENAAVMYDILLDQEQRLSARRQNPNSATAPRTLGGPEGLLVALQKASGLSATKFFLNIGGGSPSKRSSLLSSSQDITTNTVLLKLIKNIGLGSAADIFLYTNGLMEQTPDAVIDKELVRPQPSLMRALKSLRQLHCQQDGAITTWPKAGKDGVEATALEATIVAKLMRVDPATLLDWEDTVFPARGTLKKTLDKYKEIYDLSEDTFAKLCQLSNLTLVQTHTLHSLADVKQMTIADITGADKPFGFFLKYLRRAIVEMADGEFAVWTDATSSPSLALGSALIKSLARKADIPGPTWKAWEKNATNHLPGKESLDKLCAFLEPLFPGEDVRGALEHYMESTREYLKAKKAEEPEAEKPAAAVRDTQGTKATRAPTPAAGSRGPRA